MMADGVVELPSLVCWGLVRELGPRVTTDVTTNSIHNTHDLTPSFCTYLEVFTALHAVFSRCASDIGLCEAARHARDAGVCSDGSDLAAKKRPNIVRCHEVMNIQGYL